MVCVSKGLCCPVGSLLAGTTEFIKKARRFRKLLGGTMRQIGVIAAPAIIGLTEMVEPLKTDHEMAKRLAEGLK
jgi:threonine aldolase